MAVSKQATPPLDTSGDANARKRVGKACDRCRLKKSKCDGSSPCNRCRIDNAICVFGERKKTHDKAYPKGYVEMLEQQQAQLVAGLQELYRRTQTGEGWPGQPLRDAGNGHPLTHDILESLGALKHDSSCGHDGFEEDLSLLQQRLVDSGAGPMQRQSSSSSDSVYGHSPVSSTASGSSQSDNRYSIHQAPPTPPDHNTVVFPYESVDLQMQYPYQPLSQETPIFDLPQAMGAIMRQQPGFPNKPPDFTDNMDFMGKFDPSTYMGPMQMPTTVSSMQPFMTSPTLPMPDWNEDDELRAFMNPRGM